jgi:hypothetical protein
MHKRKHEKDGSPNKVAKTQEQTLMTTFLTNPFQQDTQIINPVLTDRGETVHAIMLPSCQRSLHEVTQCAYISWVLERRDKFFDDLLFGDTLYKSDIAYFIGNTILVYEHDPEYWHPEERDDITKTMRLLNHSSNVFVVRGRIGASRLRIDHPRLVQLMLPKSSTHIDLLKAFNDAVRDILPDVIMQLPDKTTEKQLLAFAKEQYKILHPDYETKILERNELFRRCELPQITGEYFVGSPVSTLEANIHVLKTEFGLKPDKIAQCASLLGRDPDTLRTNFNVLRTEFGLKPDKIAQCASLLGSNPDTLRTNFNVLKTEFGLKPDKIAQCASLLGRDPDTLRTNFNVLKTEFGLKPDKIATCASLLTSNPDTLRMKALWFNQRSMDFKNDPSMLGQDMDHIKENFEFFTHICKISPKSIGKRRICRFKLKQSHIDRSKCPMFMSSNDKEKLRIIKSL